MFSFLKPKQLNVVAKEKESETEISNKLNKIIRAEKEKQQRRANTRRRKTLKILEASNANYVKKQKERLRHPYRFIEQAGYVGLYLPEYEALMEELQSLRQENRNAYRRERELENKRNREIIQSFKDEQRRLNNEARMPRRFSPEEEKKLLASIQFNNNNNNEVPLEFQNINRRVSIASDPLPPSRPSSPFGGKRRTRKHRKHRKATRKH